jgi:phage gpG-like protein
MPQAIRVDGLADLRRDLKAIDKKLPRELNKAQRDALKSTAIEAAALAPRRSGRLAGSIRPFATARAAGLRSGLPYANVQHWGGTTGRGYTGRPNSGSVRVNPTFFAFRAVRGDLEEIMEKMSDGIERVAKRHGFR